MRCAKVALVSSLCAWLVGAAALAGDDGKSTDEPKPLRLGMIGLDTSHVVAFAKTLNGEKVPEALRNARVVAAFPGGSPDLPTSADRVEGFTKQLKDEYGVEIVDSISALLEKVDAVLLESVDGRPHLEQARPVLEAGKPMFIDKPLAASLADCIAILELARKLDVPCFTSSSLRYGPEIQALSKPEALGGITGAEVHGPCNPIEYHPELFYYGIHGVDPLFSILGPGCESVTRVSTEGTDVVVGTWRDGRIGTYRGIRQGKAGFGVLGFGEKEVSYSAMSSSYEPLLTEVITFFRTRKPPVSAEETIEIYAFMEAADESKRRGGMPVKIADTIARARAENSGRPEAPAAVRSR